MSKLSTEKNNEEYNYLAIGNSITIHGIASYWWSDDRGMAASSIQKDYVHIVNSFLEKSGKKVNMNIINFAEWEMNSHDRAQCIKLIIPYLEDNIDLITIQLGENAQNLDTWEQDFEELISYIKEKCSKAQVIVVGDFWENGNRDKLKESATKAQEAIYISLDGIKDNKDYFAGLHTTVEGKDGTLHTIEHGGVAAHPGDKGMAAIAERIIEKISL